MQYNQIVGSLREVARDVLRLKLVNVERDELLVLNNALTNCQKRHDENAAALNKAIAVANYKLGSVEDADPEATEKRESKAKFIEDAQKSLARLTEEFLKDEADYKKAIEEVQIRIAKIENGETKVDKEELSIVANCLISEVANEAVRSKLAEAMAEDIKA